MAKQYANFQPNKVAAHRNSIGGKLAVVAKRGQIVTRKAGATDEVELATGKAGLFLRRDVVEAAAHKTLVEQEQIYPNKNGFELPYIKDGSVQAEDYSEVWVEGTDLLDASMDETVTARTPVTTAAGKIAVLTDSATEETLGFVELNEAAKNGAGRRFLIEVARSAKIVVAAP